MGKLTAMREDIYPNLPLPMPADSAFSLETARILAWASQLAYEVDDSDKFNRIAKRLEWSCIGVFQQTPGATAMLEGIKGCIVQAGDAAILSFAGTEPDSLRAWNIDFHFVPGPDGISSGFGRALAAVQSKIEDLLRGMNGMPLYVTGHSLGGALAVVAAARLPATARNTIRGIYTFGMPRPGNSLFAAGYHAPVGSSLGDRTYRFRHGDDIVPTVAPQIVGAVHVGRLLHCPHGGTFDDPDLDIPGPEREELVARSALDAVRRSFASLWGERLPGFPAEKPAIATLIKALPPPARDHVMDRYLLALKDPSMIALRT